MDVKGKVVWITGASSGIGEALAKELSKKGALLILSSRRENELKRVQSQCPRTKSYVLPLDLLEIEKMSSKVQEAIQAFGKVDILINNGGISQRSLLLETSIEVDKKIMDVDYLGTVALTKALLPNMIKSGGGQIVVVSSLVGKFATPMRSAYSAAKHALHGFFDAARAELYNDNIRFTIICPGFVATNVSINALSGDGSKQNKMDKSTGAGMKPSVFAKKSIAAIEAEKKEVYIGKFETFGVYVKRYIPSLYYWLIRRVKVT